MPSPRPTPCHRYHDVHVARNGERPSFVSRSNVYDGGERCAKKKKIRGFVTHGRVWLGFARFAEPPLFFFFFPARVLARVSFLDAGLIPTRSRHKTAWFEAPVRTRSEGGQPELILQAHANSPRRTYLQLQAPVSRPMFPVGWVRFDTASWCKVHAGCRT